MWNGKNLFGGIFMTLLTIYAFRGIFLYGKTLYYVGVVFCGFLAVMFFRNCRR